VSEDVRFAFVVPFGLEEELEQELTRQPDRRIGGDAGEVVTECDGARGEGQLEDVGTEALAGEGEFLVLEGRIGGSQKGECFRKLTDTRTGAHGLIVDAEARIALVEFEKPALIKGSGEGSTRSLYGGVLPSRAAASQEEETQQQEAATNHGKSRLPRGRSAQEPIIVVGWWRRSD
jgi:hypothetical protein